MQKLYWLLALIPLSIFKATPKSFAQTIFNDSELINHQLDIKELNSTTDGLIQRLKQSK